MAGKGVTIVIQGDGASAQKALEMVRNKLQETSATAKTEASELAVAMDTVKTALAGIGVTLGIAQAISAIREMITTSLELGNALEKASLQTGLSAQTLSVLHYAAAITGSDFETMVSAVSKMDKTIGAATQGNKTAAAFMQALGLNATELAGRSDGAEIAFKKFAQTMAATENPIRRAELATGLLGKAGAAQIPVILEVASHWDEFTQKAKDAGVYLDTEGAAKLKATNERLEDLKQHLVGAGIAMTEGFTPAFSAMLNVVAGGKTPLEAMKAIGDGLGRTLAFVGMVAYSAAAGLETIFSIGEGAKLTEAGRKDYQAAVELLEQANKLQDIAFGQALPTKPVIADDAGGKPKTGGGFSGIGNQTPQKSDDSIARAAAALEQAKEEAVAAAQKAGLQSQLEGLDAAHKMMILSDEDYYAAKLRVQNEELDTQATALRQRLATLQALEQKQHSDKLLKRDKSGNSAEELNTAREIIALNTQLNDLEEKRAQIGNGANVEAQLRAEQNRLATLRMAAQVEEETNGSITARLALLREETAEEMKRVEQTSGSGSAEGQQVEALERVKEAKLEIGDVNRQITATESQYKQAVDELNDAAAKDPRLKTAVARQINQLNREEAAQLQALVQQYDALAQVLGGEFIEKARALHTELNKLNTPNQKQDLKLPDDMASGFESMAERMANATESGKSSFHSMAMSIEKDLTDMAIKLATQDLLKPFLQGLFAKSPSIGGGGGPIATEDADTSGFQIPGFAGGGDPPTDQPSVVGEEGPELFWPKSPGTVTPTGFLSKMAEGGSAGPQVTMNVTNASSQPVTARQTGSSYDSEMKTYVIHTLLEDAANGGPVSRAFGNG